MSQQKQETIFLVVKELLEINRRRKSWSHQNKEPQILCSARNLLPVQVSSETQNRIKKLLEPASLGLNLPSQLQRSQHLLQPAKEVHLPPNHHSQKQMNQKKISNKNLNLPFSRYHQTQTYHPPQPSPLQHHFTPHPTINHLQNTQVITKLNSPPPKNHTSKEKRSSPTKCSRNTRKI